MKKELLSVAQYYDDHPILYENLKFKIQYLNILEYFIQKYSNDHVYAHKLLELYKKKFLNDMHYINENIDIDKAINNIATYNLKKLNYIYILLLDNLFINAFTDKKKAYQIIEEIKSFVDISYYPNIEILYSILYDSNTSNVPSTFLYMEKQIKSWYKNKSFLKKKETKILITANMSAGKSTLINALLGKRISKTKNIACTNKAHFIINKAFEDQLSYEYDHELDLNASQEVLMDDNPKNASQYIYVGTRFRFFDECDARICIIDTPGVNSSENPHHRELTEDMIKNSEYDFMIYLLDAGYIGTFDDKKHLSFVAKHHKGKILFVINKLDQFNQDEDSVQSTIDKTREMLEDIGFRSPIICPISAYAGYLAKKKINNDKMNEYELEELDLYSEKFKWKEFQFNQYYEKEIREQTKNIPSHEETRLLLYSGIYSLEKQIEMMERGK